MIFSDHLRSILRYQPDTGDFTWLVSPHSRVRAGAIAGTPHSEGYIKLRLSGKTYYAHRLAWLYMTGAAYAKAAAELHRDFARLK